MHNIMINRYVLEFLQVFRTLAANVISFYFFVSRFSVRLRNQQKTKTETEKPHFSPFLPENVRFCRK